MTAAYKNIIVRGVMMKKAAGCISFFIFILSFFAFAGCEKNHTSDNTTSEAIVESSSISISDGDQTADGSMTGITPDLEAVTVKIGNTYGNIINGGKIALVGGYIYYCSPADTKLYRTDPDGMGKLILTDYPNVFSINASDEWVYYCQEPDQGIFKVRTDGTEKMQLVDEYCEYLYVVGDWIYYKDDNDMKIHKAKAADGSENTPVSEDTVDSFYTDGDWIFFIDEWSGSSMLHRMRTDGTENALLYDGRCTQAIPEGQWLFFINSEDEYVCRMKTNGSDFEKLKDIHAGSINVADGWIYFSNILDENKLYKVKTDGNGLTKLSDDEALQISVIDGWIYYGSLRIKTDGTGRETVG
jgi:hypothetical protein